MTLLPFLCLVFHLMMICSMVAVQGWDGEQVWCPQAGGAAAVPFLMGFPAARPPPQVHSNTWSVLSPC